jgi:hypothetical protein
MAIQDKTAKVTVDASLRFGAFANAFRVVEEIGPDVFLDFLVYSASEQEAVIVARIRVRRDFLPQIRNTLTEAMTELTEAREDSSMGLRRHRRPGKTVH